MVIIRKILFTPLIIFSYLFFQPIKRPIYFILVAFAITNVLHLRNITFYILFFVYLWSCMINQGVSLQLRNLYENYMYVYRRQDITRTFFFLSQEK